MFVFPRTAVRQRTSLVAMAAVLLLLGTRLTIEAEAGSSGTMAKPWPTLAATHHRTSSSQPTCEMYALHPGTIAMVRRVYHEDFMLLRQHYSSNITTLCPQLTVPPSPAGVCSRLNVPMSLHLERMEPSSHCSLNRYRDFSLAPGLPNVSFIHVTKTGGTSVEASLQALRGQKKTLTCHGTLRVSEQVTALHHQKAGGHLAGWAASVRNPYARAVSACGHWLKTLGVNKGPCHGGADKEDFSWPNFVKLLHGAECGGKGWPIYTPRGDVRLGTTLIRKDFHAGDMVTLSSNEPCVTANFHPEPGLGNGWLGRLRAMLGKPFIVLEPDPDHKNKNFIALRSAPDSPTSNRSAPGGKWLFSPSAFKLADLQPTIGHFRPQAFWLASGKQMGSAAPLWAVPKDASHMTPVNLTKGQDQPAAAPAHWLLRTEHLASDYSAMMGAMT